MKIDLGQTQRMIDWLKDKLYLNATATAAHKRIVRRGQVFRCNFGYGVGSEMQKDRPAVIVQNDIANKHSGNTIVIPITHDTSTLPCVVNINAQTAADGTIILDGQANAANIMCVSKARLGVLIGTLSSTEMKSIDEAIATSVGLMKYYANLNNNLNDKLAYIEQLKKQRNDAQDELKIIRNHLNISDNESIISALSNLQKNS